MLSKPGTATSYKPPGTASSQYSYRPPGTANSQFRASTAASSHRPGTCGTAATATSSIIEGMLKVTSKLQADDSEENKTERWIRIVKFVALTAWFSTPLLLRRRWRPAPGGEAGASQPSDGGRPETSGGGAEGAMTVVTALAQGAIGQASHGAIARQQVSDPVRQCWAPSEGDLEEIEAKMKDEFTRYSSVLQYSEQMINKSDFFKLLGDIPPVDIGNDPQAQQLTRAKLAEIFDEVLVLQMRNQGQAGVTFSKGLTFESFRLALLKACVTIGLHLRHLVDDAIEALCAL